MARPTYRVVNVTRGKDLAHRSRKAARFVERGVGLIGRRGLEPGGGLIIQPCSSVVSFFMRFPIDVIFVDGDGRVCHIIHSMPLWRTSKIVRSSRFVVELPAGTAADTGTEIGDKIAVEPAPG